MLALVKTPSGTAPVEIREVPEPIPAPNEALVEMRAFSLNRGELRLMQTRPEGWRPGQDISAVVLEQAADGSGPAAGTRVVALTDNAGWAQRAAVPAHRMAALPDNVRFEEAAALPVAGLTALRARTPASRAFPISDPRRRGVSRPIWRSWPRSSATARSSLPSSNAAGATSQRSAPSCATAASPARPYSTSTKLEGADP